MILYKLSDRDGYTRRGKSNETLWSEGVTHTAVGDGDALCSDGVIHAYRSPLLAAFMNPAHANIKDPILWKCDGKIVADDGTKVGSKSLTVLSRLELPSVTLEHRVRFGILCAKKVYPDPQWHIWAEGWLSVENRSADAAEGAAASAAWVAAEAGAAAAWAAKAGAAAAAAAANFDLTEIAMLAAGDIAMEPE